VRKIYMARLFRTKDEATRFIKDSGCGVLAQNTKGSRTKRDWMDALAVVGMSLDDAVEYPYAVQWNEFHE